MACVMLATVVAVSSVDAWLAGRRAQQRIETQLQDIGLRRRLTSVSPGAGLPAP